MKVCASDHGRNKRNCKGKAGRGRDGFLWFKTNKKSHFAGVKTLKKKWFVKESCKLVLIVSGGVQRVRKKLVRISVTPVGLGTSRRKLSISMGSTPELCSVVPKCRVKNYHIGIFIFSFSYWGHRSVAWWRGTSWGPRSSKWILDSSGFFISLGVFLGITKYCSVWHMLESGWDWDQKSNFQNAPHPVLNSLMGPPSSESAICGWGLPV